MKQKIIFGIVLLCMINLVSGFTILDNTEDAYVCTGSTPTNCDLGVDEDNNTGMGDSNVNGKHANLQENHTIQARATNLTWYSYIAGSWGGTATVQAWNWSSNQYDTVISTGNNGLFNASLNYDYISGNTLVINTSVGQDGFGGDTYAEGWAVWETTGEINSTFYDEINETVINVVSVELFGPDTRNLTTTNGIMNLSGLNKGEYEIVYSAPGYPKRSYYLDLTESSYILDLDLYLLHENEGVYTNFNVEDETGNLLENATVKLLRRYLSCDCFKVVEMDITNFVGTSILQVDQYDGNYQLIAEYDDTTIFVSTNTTGYELSQEAYTLTGNTLDDTTESFFGTRNIYTNISWNPTTFIYSYTVNDPEELVNNICFIVERLTTTGAGKENICNSCLAAASGTVTCNVTSYYNSTTEFITKGYVDTNTQFTEYFTDILSFVINHDVKNTLGTLGVLLGALLIAAFAIVFLIVLKSAAGVFVGLAIGLILTKAGQLIELSLSSLFGTIFILLFLAYIVGRGKE